MEKLHKNEAKTKKKLREKRVKFKMKTNCAKLRKTGKNPTLCKNRYKFSKFHKSRAKIAKLDTNKAKIAKIMKNRINVENLFKLEQYS